MGLPPDLLVSGVEGLRGETGIRLNFVSLSEEVRGFRPKSTAPLYLSLLISLFFSAPTLVLEYSAAVPFLFNFSLSDFSL